VSAIVLVSKWLRSVSAVALTFLLTVTVLDVVLRAVWKPIVGVYELVSYSGAVVIAFALPLTSWEKGHVYMDFVVDRLSDGAKRVFYVATRVLVILFFVTLGIALLVLAAEFKSSGELLLTLKFPVYPMTYVISGICFLQSVVIFFDILRELGGKNE
jgi:TRAP-type C4-dicarboxylate transport system permease small subunit